MKKIGSDEVKTITADSAAAILKPGHRLDVYRGRREGRAQTQGAAGPGAAG